MSKIICDICGTVYPDNATVCPICGYPRQDSEKAVLNEAEKKASTTRNAGTYVKGGRFSAKNVKKRHMNEGTVELPRAKKAEPPKKPEQPKKMEQPLNEEEPESFEPEITTQRPKANPALKAVVAVLAVAVIVVSGYIAYRFIDGANAYDRPNTLESTGETETTLEESQATTVPAETGVACIGLNVSDENIAFEGSGRAWLLNVMKIPENATDEVVFTSSDENVVTVSQQGRVTSVGPGQAVITITCGSSVRECQVFCNFDGVNNNATEGNGNTTATTSPTEATENTNYKDQNWEMNNEYGDATLIIGEEFSLELRNDAGEIADVQWSADHDGVVSIDGNNIKGENVGTVDVTATIGGKTFTCIVRVIQNR